MENFKSLFWILFYVFLIIIVPAIVVFLATFITGLGFFLRDLKYDIAKALKKKASPP
jgi:ABC-type antimicrobial peptide transport system permease subunit